MAISTPGIGSGLDVNGIVSKLMSVESQPMTRLLQKEASYQADLTAYGTLNGALSSFQSAVAGMNSLANFQSFSASSADSTVLTGSASSTASAGSYSINVTALTQAHTLMAAGNTSNTASLANGADTLSFRFGTAGTPASFGAAKTVSIAANSSLQNIADSVNSANIGVSATIVNDGSATPYHLVFTSTNPGAANSMSVTAATDATLQGMLNYDQVGAAGKNMTQTAAGQNAALTVNNIPISSASNTVTGAISGVTLNLAKIGATTLNVAQNTSQVQTAVQNFVKAYNDLNKSFSDLTGYDASTKKGGPLQGDSTVLGIQAQIRRTLSSALPAASGSLTTLSQVGISFQKDGTLALDSTKLQTAITNNFSDLAGLFTAAGKVTDSLISFAGSTDQTRLGTSAINITTMATQGTDVGAVNLNAGNTVITTGVNDTLSLTLDGNSSSVTLAAGTYTAAQLAALTQSAINGNSTFSSSSSSVAVTVDALTGFMHITSNRYGSASNITVSNSGAGATLLGASASTAGVDVAGSINGVTATGSGQYLTGVDGLKLLVSGGVTGQRGSVSFTQGFAYQLNNQVSAYLANPGLLSSRTDGINRTIADLGKQQTALQDRLTATEARYRAQFTQLDTLISSLNATQASLTSELASLPKTA